MKTPEGRVYLHGSWVCGFCSNEHNSKEEAIACCNRCRELLEAEPTCWRCDEPEDFDEHGRLTADCNCEAWVWEDGDYETAMRAAETERLPWEYPVGEQ